MKHPHTPTELDMDRFGQYFSDQLTLACADLPHDIGERLRVARHLAIAQRKPLVQSRLVQKTQINCNGTLTGQTDEGLNRWSFMASALPLLALVTGLMAFEWVQQDHITSEIAATDSALLTDELPPDAYTDAGFAQFLKQSHGQPIRHE